VLLVVTSWKRRSAILLTRQGVAELVTIACNQWVSHLTCKSLSEKVADSSNFKELSSAVRAIIIHYCAPRKTNWVLICLVRHSWKKISISKQTACVNCWVSVARIKNFFGVQFSQKKTWQLQINYTGHDNKLTNAETSIVDLSSR